ncbi:MAG: hypothetical protein IJP03_01100 [Christensenellaceae bacterium]|nr:hypothetical protein [Christensenellaceae bacterium]
MSSEFLYYFENLGPEFEGLTENPMLMEMMSTIFIVVMTIVGILVAVFYVFTALGLHVMGKTRGIPKYGLAWVPGGDMWIMGRLADQYDDVVKGKNMRLRHWLLWLFVGMLVLSFANGLLSVLSLAADPDMGLLGIAEAVDAVYSLVQVALSVFMYIALYKIYRSASPKNATLMTVFSILFSACMPFMLFSIRKKTAGMPYLPGDAAAAQNTEEQV